MKEQLRITPEEAIDAYEKTGLVPVSDDYCFSKYAPLKKWIETCGCPLTALYCATKEDPQDYIERTLTGLIAQETVAWAWDRYGEEYATHFVHGFDGNNYIARGTEGYRDGSAVRRAVVEKLGVLK